MIRLTICRISRVALDWPAPSLMHRRRGIEKPITYIGLDVHKNTIAVAVAESGLRKEVREHGTIPNTPAAVKKLITKLASSGNEPRFCYEGGPCGYGIQRQITAVGHECVVAPSLIPKRLVIGSKPTGGMRSISPSCTGQVN